VDVCVYFIAPHRLKQMDVEFMKRLSQVCQHVVKTPCMSMPMFVLCLVCCQLSMCIPNGQYALVWKHKPSWYFTLLHALTCT